MITVIAVVVSAVGWGRGGSRRRGERAARRKPAQTAAQRKPAAALHAEADPGVGVVRRGVSVASEPPRQLDVYAVAWGAVALGAGSHRGGSAAPGA